MDLYSTTEPENRNVQTIEEATSIRATGSPAAGTASVLKNAVNPRIKNSTFNIFSSTNNFTAGTSQVLDIVYSRVAPHAILNAGGRADEVKCHPGTREEVIERIERWRDAADGPTASIFWLSGPAGAGKTAIVQTIAERCKAQGMPQANFFFFRADSSRSSASSLVATLLHQLILLYPSLHDPVASVLSANPLIFNSILEDQLAQLIVEPLRTTQQASSSYSPPTLLIDGLDECDSENKHIQRQILRTFDKFLAKHLCPFRLLVASRDESQISTAFNEISSLCLPLYLDSEYSPESDIRVFVIDKFKAIRKTHPLAHTLGASWPSVKDVEGIVKKSSGQFIYAATVMRFIGDSSASPILSLERVQGATQIATKSPFSHLDAIYAYILCQADDQQTLKDILHAHFLIQGARGGGQKIVNNRLIAATGYTRSVELAQLLKIYNPRYTTTILRSCLADLTPIAQYTRQGYDCQLLFHHASFPDYLLNQSRSGDYFVDIDAFNFKILPAVWKCIGSNPDVRAVAYYGVHTLRKLPPDFLKTLSRVESVDFGRLGRIWLVKGLFNHIFNLCACDNDVISLKRIIRRWINSIEDSDIDFEAHCTGNPPYIRRYFVMAHIERTQRTQPRNPICIALRSETVLDTRETASWLNELLHFIHNRKYVDYQMFLKEWISWAVWNDIPLDGLDDIPNARWYLLKSTMKKWLAGHLKIGKHKY